MAKTRTKTGWGIDEPACAVFEDGRFKGTLGRSVYEIVMTDFETQAYRMTECAICRSGPCDVNPDARSTDID